MGLALLAQGGLPTKFWDDAFISSTYISNRLPSKAIQLQSPFAKLFKTHPDYHSLKAFGCLCYPLTRPYNKHKLQYRSEPATFIGYSTSHKGYKALLPSGKVILTRDITFDESSFPFLHADSNPHSPTPASSTGPLIINPPPPPISLSPTTIPPSNTLPATPSQPSSIPAPPPTSVISPPALIPSQSSSIPTTTPTSNSADPPVSPSPSTPTPPPVHHMITRGKAGIIKPKSFNLTISPSLIPKSALIALLIPVWKQAMLEEFLALLRNKTWVLTKLPPGKNLVGCTWIFRIKRHIDGCIARHKARLVAQGFSQQLGFDFTDTFSPVVKPQTIRIILSFAISAGWSITHLDVNNAFLHGDLTDEIYMRQPPDFEQGSPQLVCKLNKAIYGLKQASRSWFLTVLSVLLSLEFKQSKADPSLFFRIKGNEVIYLLIYVDDMLVTGNSRSGIHRVINQLGSHFSLKDLGEVRQFLGIEVTRTKQGLHLCQANYIKDLLKKAKMEDARGCPTPMVSSCELSKVVGSPTIDGTLYRSMVGGSQYATIMRPDISFAVNKVSQYMANPLDSHWKAVKRILRYLAGTADYGLHLRPSDDSITTFSDSDWASDLDDRRSTTGYCTYFGSNLISWCAKKQSVVSRSSTEAEYRSLAHVAAEITWIQSLLSELGVKEPRVPVAWVDNLSAIAIASNPVLHARTKHIELDVHFSRDKVLAKKLDLRHVPSADQVADILTKPLSLQLFSRLRNKLGVCSQSSLELRGRVRRIDQSDDGVNELQCQTCNMACIKSDLDQRSDPPQLKEDNICC